MTLVIALITESRIVACCALRSRSGTAIGCAVSSEKVEAVKDIRLRLRLALEVATEPPGQFWPTGRSQGLAPATSARPGRRCPASPRREAPPARCGNNPGARDRRHSADWYRMRRSACRP